ncbi:MAG: hypothetical protein H0U67_13415 [Gemmatimonadetes bacterium]|nr:hypothetical protein [Gemmatimonadota bacterium]
MRSALVLLVSLSLGLTGKVAAQTGYRVNADEENIRAEANGDRVAVVNRGFRLVGGEARGQWRQITLDAWVPARSVTVSRRDGFTLAVGSGGAALHTEPGGSPVGRTMGGVQLNEVSRQGSWVRVQRPAWIWSPSLAPAPLPATSRTAAPPPATRNAPVAADSVAAPSPAPVAAGRTLSRSPDGRDTIAHVGRETQMEVLGREGEWARVRVEGWVRVGANESLNAPGPLRDLSLRALRADPERFRGATLQWQVQFMALQRADSVRTDFQRGEPYILARDPGGEPGFVYIAVPNTLLAEVRKLAPLERIEVVARVRSGRSPLTGHPVLELVELRR